MTRGDSFAQWSRRPRRLLLPCGPRRSRPGPNGPLKSRLTARDDKSALSSEASAIRDPIRVQDKGRPSQKSLRNHSEGPKGVSKKKKGNKCSRCGAVGHNRVTCKSEGHQATAGSSPAETSGSPVKKVACVSPLAEVKTFKRGGTIGSYIEKSS